MKNKLVPLFLISILLWFPSDTFASKFKWTVEYLIDMEDGKYQKVKIELPKKRSGVGEEYLGCMVNGNVEWII